MIRRKWLISRIYATWGFLMRDQKQLNSGRGIGRTASRAACRPLTSAMGSTRIGARESGVFLASQARHEMGAPVGLFAGAKRGPERYAKVRIVSRSYAKFHESSHRSGPWLRDVTHCYGGDQFFD